MPLSDKKLAGGGGGKWGGSRLEARRRRARLGTLRPAQSLEVGKRRKQALKSAKRQSRYQGRGREVQTGEGQMDAGLCNPGWSSAAWDLVSST